MLAVVHSKISDDMKRAIDKPSLDYSGMKIGYARVSTDDQSLDLQVKALKAFGCEDDHIHREQASGASTKRPKLDTAFQDARPGDTLVVWKLDRLGRSMIDLLHRLQDLDARGIGFVSLTERIDTTTPAGRLLLHIMGALAQFERDLIRERTKAGQEAARARGVQIGHEPKIDMAKAAQMFARGATVRQVAERFKCVRSAVYQRFDMSMRDRLRHEYLEAQRLKRKTKE